MFKALKYAAIGVIATAALAGCSSPSPESAPGTSVSESAPVETKAAAFTLPDYTGKTLDVATKELKAAGVKHDAVDMVDDKAILSEKNWTIASHEPAAGTAVEAGSTVMFQVHKPEAAPAPGEATTAGLKESEARMACMMQADAAFPYGHDIHWIVGQVAHEIQSDKWFFKTEADITNAFDAKKKTVTECTVSGTNEAPVVESFIAY